MAQTKLGLLFQLAHQVLQELLSRLQEEVRRAYKYFLCSEDLLDATLNLQMNYLLQPNMPVD